MDAGPSHLTALRHAWWREGEILILAALVVAAYFLRGDLLTLRGEESRRATVAIEMMRTGDWIVPRQQGELFLSRPPMHNWLIAAAAALRGACDVWAIRLPTLVAVLLTTLLVYACGRGFLSRLGAFAAALAFATMGEVLQMGRLAECDLVFTYFLSSAVLLWHCGYTQGWAAHWTWTVGCALTAAAALTKGPQAPVYFASTVAIWLMLQGDRRSLFGRAAAIGAACFVVLIGMWQVPYLLSAGWPASIQIWAGDSAARFENLRIADVIRHLATFPLEVLGCTAPWSFFLAAFLSRRFRRSLSNLGPHVRYFSIYCVIAFLPCWASPGGMTRYCLPMYPALALLIGVVAERAAVTSFSRRLSWSWSVGWRCNAVVAVAAAVVICLVSVLPLPAAMKPWAQPWPICLGFFAISLIAGRSLWRMDSSVDRPRLRFAIVSMAGFLALAYSSVVVNALAARSENSPAAMARLKARLPADARLVSLNGVHHLFAYLYAEPIAIRPWPSSDDPALTWFCFDSVGEYRPAFPFAWEEFAVISVDRNHHDRPKNVVVVGRRLSQSPSLAHR